MAPVTSPAARGRRERGRSPLTVAGQCRTRREHRASPASRHRDALQPPAPLTSLTGQALTLKPPVALGLGTIGQSQGLTPSTTGRPENCSTQTGQPYAVASTTSSRTSRGGPRQTTRPAERR